MLVSLRLLFLYMSLVIENVDVQIFCHVIFFFVQLLIRVLLMQPEEQSTLYALSFLFFSFQSILSILACICEATADHFSLSFFFLLCVGRGYNGWLGKNCSMSSQSKSYTFLVQGWTWAKYRTNTSLHNRYDNKNINPYAPGRKFSTYHLLHG